MLDSPVLAPNLHSMKMLHTTVLHFIIIIRRRRLYNLIYNKNLPWLCTRTGKSTRVSKICSPWRGLRCHGSCKSLTWGWISLSLYRVVVDYFSPTAFYLHNKTPFVVWKTTSKHFLVRKQRQLGLIMKSHNYMIYDVTRCLLKSFPN